MTNKLFTLFYLVKERRAHVVSTQGVFFLIRKESVKTSQPVSCKEIIAICRENVRNTQT
jgi:hypothetical protein